MMSRPSNSGIATCIAASMGDRAASDASQAALRRGQAQPLEHRHVQLGERADVPGLVVAAGGASRRARAARREHRGDQRVGPAEQLVQLRVGAAQRTAVHGRALAPACLDRVAQRVDEGGVPGELVRAVEEHADGRPALHVRARAVHARTPASSAAACERPRRSAARCRRGTGPARRGSPDRPRRDSAAPPRPHPRARTTRPSAPRRARPRRPAARSGSRTP